VDGYTLPSGAEIPTLGLGVWQMEDDGETEQAVRWALELGYRHIDTAAMYRNERGVGDGIRASGIAREDVFVTTKLVPAREDPAGSLRESLDRLGFDYVDLYLIHWPRGDYVAQWQALEQLRADGLARDVGVSNFGRRELDALVKAGAQVPAVNQCHFSPLRHDLGLLELCRERGIVFEAYSPLEQGVGPRNRTVVQVAERVGRTPGQVLIRWAIQHGTVVIPKSSRRERIEENAQVFDFELDAEAMAALDALG
jgi:diketogulonate reductase-like aldo/keto reductase